MAFIELQRKEGVWLVSLLQISEITCDASM